jgi:hypothetical protein
MRLSLITLFAFSLSCFAFGSPRIEQVALQPDGTVHTTEGWEYVDCGWYHVPNSVVYDVHTPSGLPSDIVQIESIEVKPDPPKPGQDLTVRVKASATDIIEVDR